MSSSVTGGVVALYPSPAGATESELDLAAWASVVDANPELRARARRRGADRQPAGRRAAAVIAPIDAAYGLVGLVKARGRGSRAAPAVREAVAALLRRPCARGRRSGAADASPAPGVRGARRAARSPHAAAPTLRFTLRVAEPSGRDGATRSRSRRRSNRAGRRRYDDADARAAGRALRRARALGATTTQPVLWRRSTCSCRRSRGTTEFTARVPAPTTSRWPRRSTSTPAGRRGAAGFHFSGRILYRGDDGRLQVVLVPWSCSAAFRLPVATWREMIARHYPDGGWMRLQTDTLAAAPPARPSAGCRRFDATVAELLRMTRALDELVDSLLYEGYALYPYTPGATKNATPTPFGIVYPPATPASRATLRPPADGVPGARETAAHAEVRFLRRAASATRRASGGSSCRSRASAAFSSAACAAARGCELPAGRRGVATVRVENRPRCRRASTAPRRCEHSLLSTHPSLRVRRRALRLPAARPQGCAQRQHLARARHRRRRRRARRRDRAARPPAARPREPRRACSTRPRSRRRCCCTCRRSATRSARRSRSRPGGARDGRARADATTPEELDAARPLRPARARPMPPTPARGASDRGERGRRTVTFRPRRHGRAAARPGRNTQDRMLEGRHGDDRADLHRLRRAASTRRDGRRRPRPGAACARRAASCSSVRRGGGRA